MQSISRCSITKGDPITLRKLLGTLLRTLVSYNTLKTHIYEGIHAFVAEMLWRQA